MTAPPKKKRTLPEGFVKRPVADLLATIDLALLHNDVVMTMPRAALERLSAPDTPSPT